MLLITIFVELRVVAGRNRMLAGRPHAVSGRRPMLIHTCHAHAHAALCCGLEKSLSGRRGLCIARARHGMCELAFNVSLYRFRVKLLKHALFFQLLYMFCLLSYHHMTFHTVLCVFFYSL
jgi:hypothetical protein